MNAKARIAVLGGLFVVLMSLPWLVPHAGFTALFGLVPLLLMEETARHEGMKRFWLWHYGAFVLWNAVTTFWVCNATVGGGIFAVMANALQMSVVFGIFRLSRRRFGGTLPYVLLACLWIAWERWYFSTQISWPWLTLGNAFARSTRLIQWYEYTGTLGGSLWIWLSNLAIYGALTAFSSPSRPRRRVFVLASAALLLILPPVLSLGIYSRRAPSSAESLDVAIIQPDFDPYQKFHSMSRKQQNDVLLNLSEPFISARADSAAPLLIIAPETFTDDICLNHVKRSPSWKTYNSMLEGKPGVNLLYGASSYEIFNQRSRPSILAREYGNYWTESHNSALMQDWTGRTEIFHKSKLVVGTELTPYPKLFVPIDDKLGGVMGRCIGQDEISLLNVADARDGSLIPVGCAICYESVYGEYCAGYVRKGARAMTVITNDAWWGDTPGYRQHLSYSALRAIELRRDIARCANTGISAVIDSRGDYVLKSGWWTRETLEGSVRLSDEITAFVRYGDVCGRICTLAAVLLLLILVVTAISGKTLRKG